MKNNKGNHSENILSTQASLFDAKSIIEKNQYDYISIVEENRFHGILLKEDVMNEEEDLNLDEISHLLKPVFLRADFTLFDWLKISSTNNLSSLPVVDDSDMSFKGIFDFNDIFGKFKNTGLNVEGSTVLIIKKSSKSFSYNEVFQIAEANAAKIFGTYINSSDIEETEIVLNIYHTGLNELLQSYRRYDYDIVSLHEEDLHQETLKANSEYFSKYLTV